MAGFAKEQGLLLPSTAPCHPAPGRNLLIIRTDSPSSTSWFNFNNIVPSISSSESQALRPQQSQSTLEASFSSPSSILERFTASLEQTTDPIRKRASFLRNFIGSRSSDTRSRSQSPKPQANQSSPDSSPEKAVPRDPARRPSPDRANIPRKSLYESRGMGNTSSDDESDSTTQRQRSYNQAYFNFSLEPFERSPSKLPINMKLEPPRLPLAAQLLLIHQPDFVPDVPARAPVGQAAISARYSGRALAEWTLIVNECQNFFERRRSEGVPSNRLVETPTLNVESLRRPGAASLI